MNKYNRILTTLVALVMVISILASCGGAGPTATPAPTVTAVAAQPADTAVANVQVGASNATPAAGMVMTPTVSSDNGAATPTAAMAVSPSVAIAYGTPGVLADTGFRAETNGFSFQNFGNQYPATPGTFTVDEARKLLGDKAICASVDSSNACTASPAALQWIDQMNKGINGGHCEGFAVSSMQLYKGIVKVSDLGTDSVNKLQLDPANPSSNPTLLNLIAGDWVLQTLNPVQAGRDATFTLKPNQILDAIIASMQNGAPDPLTLAFWKPGYKEGHAVVPIWVEDKGNNIVWLHIYDNNYPNQDRYIIFDRAAQTWTYSTAADPRQDASAYLGDATTQTLAVIPLSLRSQPPVCPFCKTGSGSGLFAPSGQQQEQVIVDGSAAMLFTDKDGHQFGYKDGRLVSDIPGANQTLLPGGLGHDHSPIYNLPEGGDFQASLEGAATPDTNTEEIAMFGQGEAVDIAGIKLGAGANDNLSISGDGQKISYKPSEAETPEVKIANNDGAKDYGFDLSGIDFSAGEEVDFSVDDSTGKLAIKDTTGTPDNYNLSFTETDASGTHSFKHNDIALNPGDTEYIDFGAWQDGGAVNIGVDQGSNGTIDQTLSEAEQP